MAKAKSGVTIKDFSLLDPKQDQNPAQEFYPDSQDTSIGQLPAYKLMTGATRGDQQIKGQFLIVDKNGVKRMAMGYKKDAF